MEERDTSQKLKVTSRILITSIAVTAIFLLISIILVCLKNYYLSKAFLSFVVFGFIGVFVSTIFYDRVCKEATNLSTDYYKNKLPSLLKEIIISVFCFVLGTIATQHRVSSNIGFSSLESISIGTFSLIFVLYVFILPSYKKSLNKRYKTLQYAFKKTKTHKNIEKLQKIQSIIYKNSKLFNALSISMIVSTLIFALSIFMVVFFDAIYFTYISVAASILYDLYFIIELVFVIGNFYCTKLEEVEIIIEKQNQQLEKTLRSKKDNRKKQ